MGSKRSKMESRKGSGGATRLGVQGSHRRRSFQAQNMKTNTTPQQLKQQSEDLKQLLEETATGMGGSNTSYTELLRYLSEAGELRMPQRFLPGQMVFFKYKPQDARFMASTNPYDMFPLVIITSVNRFGFEGINLHFIAQKWRRNLFDAIEQSLPIRLSGDPALTRLGATYERLQGRRKFGFFKPCYRSYLRRGFRKFPIQIPQDYWDVLVDVDLAHFIKGKKIAIRRAAYASAILSGNKP